MKTRRTRNKRRKTNKRRGGFVLKYPKIDDTAKEMVESDLNYRGEPDEDDGRIYRYHLVLVPLDMIPSKAWNPIRFKSNCKLLEERKTTKPILLGLGYDGKIQLVDGNHRTECAKQYGYTHIPAIIDSPLYAKMKDKFIDLQFP